MARAEFYFAGLILSEYFPLGDQHHHFQNLTYPPWYIYTLQWKIQAFSLVQKSQKKYSLVIFMDSSYLQNVLNVLFLFGDYAYCDFVITVKSCASLHKCTHFKNSKIKIQSTTFCVAVIVQISILPCMLRWNRMGRMIKSCSSLYCW